MSDLAQTVRVRLEANVAGYRAAMALAAADTKRLSNELTGAGKTGKTELRELGTGAMLLGGGMLVGFGLAAKAAMDFDARISEVGAVASASGEQLDQLRQQALDAGQATVFSASEAASAQIELAKAGVSTSDILSGALTGSLNLASAGSLDLARSAELGANAMTIFGLSGDDMGHIADLLAAGANKSAASVDEMGQALAQGGLLAAQTGLSIEDTTGVLALFANGALKGSDAGTSLKTMLMRLTPQSKEAATAMEELGLEFFDAKGNFMGIGNVAEQLKTKLGSLSAEQRSLALNTIFGSDASRAATLLMQEGAAGVAEWTGLVNDSGYAAELAAQKTDNLRGDVEALSGSFETALIESGSQANGVLRSLVQTATDLVNGFGSLPGPAQGAAMGILGIGGAALATIGGITSLAPKFREISEILTGMGPAGAKASSALGHVGTGLAAAVPGIIAATLAWESFEKAGRDAYEEFTKDWPVPRGYSDSAEQLNKLNAEYQRLQKVASDGDGIIGFFAEFGQIMSPLPNTISDAEAASREYESHIKELNSKLRNQREVLSQLAPEFGMTADEVQNLADKYGIDLTTAGDSAIESMRGVHAEMSTGTPVSQQLGTAISGLVDPTKSVKEQFDQLNEVITATFDKFFGLGDAKDALQAKLNDLPEVLKAVQGNYEGTSDAAIEYREHMRGMVEDAGSLIEEQAKLVGQGPELQSFVDQTIFALESQWTAWGISREEIEKFLAPLRELQGIPGINTEITVEANQAIASVRELAGAVGNLVANMAAVNAAGALSGFVAHVKAPGLTKLGGRASGGMVPPWSMAQVAETRPEIVSGGGRSYLVTSSQPAYVTSQSATAAAMAGSGSTTHVTHHHTYQVDVTGFGDRDELKWWLMDAMRDVHAARSGRDNG